MRRYFPAALGIFSIAVIVGVVSLRQPASRITVANKGSHAIEIKTDGSERNTLLPQNGMGYFDNDSKIVIDDALIIVGRRIEVINTGSRVIQVAYSDASGSQRFTALGKGGSGYFSKTTPLHIGDVSVHVGSVPE